jgi:predicted acylesterase/phospholipase RssA
MQKIFFFLLALVHLAEAKSQQAHSRILVVSGGGSRGAWGAGFAKRLSDSLGIYDISFGTSTGSLMGPLILLGDFKRLQEAYTTVTQEKIFNVNPFKKNGELHTYNSVLRVLFRKKTLGESNNLRKLIDVFVKDEDYEKIRQSKVLGVAVVELTTGEKKIKLSTEIASTDVMKDWIWASSNQPVLMSYFFQEAAGKTDYYVDAGVQETVPVSEALQYAVEHPNVTNIDVVVNRPKFPAFEAKQPPATILKGMLRIMDIWRTRTEVVDYDLLLATQATEADRLKGDTIHISLHHFPSELFLEHHNSLLFDPVKMTKLWNEGTAGREDSVELISKPNQITVSREAARHYFKQLKAFRDKLRRLSNE